MKVLGTTLEEIPWAISIILYKVRKVMVLLALGGSNFRNGSTPLVTTTCYYNCKRNFYQKWLWDRGIFLRIKSDLIGKTCNILFHDSTSTDENHSNFYKILMVIDAFSPEMDYNFALLCTNFRDDSKFLYGIFDLRHFYRATAPDSTTVRVRPESMEYTWNR